jgi:hypothetical protein
MNQRYVQGYRWVGDPDESDVDEWSTMPSWDGERMDLDWVVSTLAQD